MTSEAPPSRVLFVTGRLAEAPLRRVLSSLDAGFDHDIAVLNITVAALMTTEWIGRHLRVARQTDLVLIPGLCEGDTDVIANRFGVRVEKGPKDLHAIPDHFGSARNEDYGAWDIEIAAEINNAGKLTRREIRQAADAFCDSGADIIDIGCTPGFAFPGLGDTVAELVAAGIRVSVDTFDPGEIRVAVDRGAELVLSVNSSNLEVVRDLAGAGARAVVVPDLGSDLRSLAPSLEEVTRWDVPYLIDPILEPIGYGFMASLERYAQIRRAYPDAEMLMGIGNLTEMTAADSTGVNALLIAICQELGVRTVLTTEVIGWARGAVREADVARRLMYDAIRHRKAPKHADDRLVTLRDASVLSFDENELAELQRDLTDSNFRIFADREAVTVLNSEIFVRGTDVDELFSRLGVDEATHAFYLGKELARARLAMMLGKTYQQDGAMRWGYIQEPRRDPGGRTRLTGVPGASSGGG